MARSRSPGKLRKQAPAIQVDSAYWPNVIEMAIILLLDAAWSCWICVVAVPPFFLDVLLTMLTPKDQRIPASIDAMVNPVSADDQLVLQHFPYITFLVVVINKGVKRPY